METKRLKLRPLRLDDAGAFYPLFNDEETMRFMHVLPHSSVEETRNLLEHDLKNGAEYWTIRLRESGEIVGNVNFIGGARVPGIGYILRRDHWGQGLMTEALSAVLTHAFNVKNLDRVELWINVRNLASQRVAEKLGFHITGRIHQRYDWETNHHIMLTYGLWAADWLYAESPLPRRRPAFFGAQPVLAVWDVARTIAFYRRRLGFEIDFTVGDPPEHAGMARGHWSSDQAYLQFARVPHDARIEPAGWLYFMVEAQIDDLYEEYKAKGVEVIWPPRTHPWGMREFSIRDLNGYELRFGTRQAGE